MKSEVKVNHNNLDVTNSTFKAKKVLSIAEDDPV
jgi:hypothetical protein